MIRTAVLALALAAATNAAVLSKATDAPADEYFGPFKLSAISMRTKIDALARNYRQRWQDDASIVHDALLVENAYHAWAQKYPQDRWLAPTAYHLAQLYAVVQTADARNHARAMYQEVAKTFPTSKEAHSARLRLRAGFPALRAESPVSRTPNPYARASPSPAESAPPTAAPAAVSPAPASSVPASPAPSTSPRPRM